MTMEPLLRKRSRYGAAQVHQQLGFNALDAGGLLQGLNHMSEQAFFYLQGTLAAAAIGHIEVANHSLAAFIDKKRIPRDSSALHCRVARENFAINVAQDHRR